MNSAFFMVDLQKRVDPRGCLMIAEFEKQLPFQVKRMFTMFNIEGDATRADHANRESKFFMVALSGRCKVCADDGAIKEEFLLDSPYKGLFLDNMTWKSIFDFSPDCILAVLSDCLYKESEYIRDYGEFCEESV